MCVVSMIADHYIEKWSPKRPVYIPPQISKEEIEEFRRLLERAREYDRQNNEPNCELDEKKKILRDLAKNLGIEINFL